MLRQATNFIPFGPAFRANVSDRTRCSALSAICDCGGKSLIWKVEKGLLCFVGRGYMEVCYECSVVSSD